MAGISYYAAQKTLDCWLNGQAVTPPSARYFALYQTDPAPGNTGIEITGDGYSRVPIPSMSFAAVESSRMTCKNTAMISLPRASGDWTEANYFAILDAQTGGNLIAFGQLRVPKTASSGDLLEFQPNELIVTLS